MSDSRPALEQLLQLMERLRDPDTGCPWDQQQDFASILPHTLEEAHEVADAILREDWEHLREELGDLLFQVVFHAQLGKEQSLFDFDEICAGIVAKLLRRHPHVFPDGTLASARPAGQTLDPEVIAGNWQRIKQAEKAAQPQASEAAGVLDQVARHLPPLKRARALQKAAASVGFDWEQPLAVLDKLREEIDELQAELLAEHASERDRQARLQDELGDLLFVCVNLSRFLKLDPDATLMAANGKFERRFRYIERRLAAMARRPEDASLEEMETLWTEAKRHGL